VRKELHLFMNTSLELLSTKQITNQIKEGHAREVTEGSLDTEQPWSRRFERICPIALSYDATLNPVYE
jgi:hypothetical protein